MAPKRSAPPPPVESSEETASVSGTDESEEEMALSPPSVTPKYAPPPQKVQQPESSDEEEEDEEDEEEEDEEDEEEVGTEPNPPAATQNPPPPPPKHEESESGEEEEEETDDEAAQPVGAPKQEAQREGRMPPPPPPREGEKPAEHIQRPLSKADEVRILEVLATHRREKGMLPQTEELEAVLASSLDIGDYGSKELAAKLKTLKASYTKAANKGAQMKDRDSRFFDLCKEVWGGGDMPTNVTAPRDFSDICQMYPFLGEEIRKVEKAHPGLFKRQYNMITDEKARALDQRIKKQRVSQIKLELRRTDVMKEVTKTLMGLLK